MKKIKCENKLSCLFDRDKLIKVKKRNENKIKNNLSKKKNNNRNLMKNKTMTDFNHVKKNLNLTTRNDGNKQNNKILNYHIYI